MLNFNVAQAKIVVSVIKILGKNASSETFTFQDKIKLRGKYYIFNKYEKKKSFRETYHLNTALQGACWDCLG